MARKKRIYRQRVYIPQQRGLLGPRHRLKLAEVERPFDYHTLTARWLHERDAGIETVEQAMPKGGKRIMARCPQCRMLRRELYVTPFLRCRVCAGKFYLSRDGYRPRSRLTDAQRQAFDERREFAEYLVLLKCHAAVTREMANFCGYFVKQAEKDARRERKAAEGKARRTSAEAKRVRRLRRDLKKWIAIQQAWQQAFAEAQRLQQAA